MRRQLVFMSVALAASAILVLQFGTAASAVDDAKNNSKDDARNEKVATLKTQSFGKMPEGKETTLFTLTNAHRLVLKLTDYGARIVAVEAPDKNGKLANLVLGFDSVDGYVKHKAYFGTTTGRFCNRIAAGKFTLDGKQYTLATNNGANHLHGGLVGFDRKVWDVAAKSDSSVTFAYTSKDGEEGFPGTLKVTVAYTLTDDNEVKITYQATTDKPTVLNLTNHAYWNLGGAGSGDVLAHEVMLAADKYLPIDKGSIPTGQLADVKGTVMDFTQAKTIGSRIAELKRDPEGTKGYDHCYVLRNQPGQSVLAARVKDPKSGRVMEIRTTEPGVQLYTGNFLDGDPINGGYQQHAALCLETQHFPDSPNHKDFPSTVLNPGETYRQVTTHKFSVE